MAIFPLNAPLNSDSLIKTACRLYRLSVLKVLPLSIFLVLIFNFILYGAYLFEPLYLYLYKQAAIISFILFFPLTGTLFYLIDIIGNNLPYSFGNLLFYTLERFLSLVGCLFSMLFIPALILGLCISIYLALGLANVSRIFLFMWFIFCLLLLFAACVSKLLAPILVFCDKQNADDSIENSAQLVKGHFVKTFVFGLLAGLILLFFAKLGFILTTHLTPLKTISPLWIHGLSQLLLILIAPWSFALLLTLKYDLQIRYAQKPPRQNHPTRFPTLKG